MARRSRSRGLTQSQKTFVTRAYQAASLAGLSGVQADLAVSQAVHESAWGTRPSGVNNYHGIKGKGTSVRTHEIEAGKRRNVTASFRNFGSMTDSFKAWADVVGKKFSGVMSATSLKDAVRALRAGKPGGYATDPQYSQKITSAASRIADVAAGPWGAGPAQAYAQAQYQRAMPGGPTPPATAPVPSSRPLDSLGGLGATYDQANFRSRVAPSSQVASVGERFGQSASPTSLDLNQSMAPSIMGNAYGQWARPMAAATLNDMMTGRNMPAGPATAPDQSQRFRPGAAPAPAAPSPLAAAPVGQVTRAPTGPAPSAPSPLAAAPVGSVTRAALAPAMARSVPVPTARPDYTPAAPSSLAAAPVGAVSRAPLGPAQSRAVPTPTARPDYASPEQRMAGVVPPSATVSSMLAGRNMPVSPAPAPAMAIDPGRMYAYAGRTRSLAPATPVGQAAVPATAPAAPAPSRFGPQAPVAAAVRQVANTPMAVQPASPPLGAVNAPLGPAASPETLAAARQLGIATAAQQIAPPAAMDAARKLGNAIAAQQIATPATLAEKVSQPAQTVQQAQQRPAQNVQQRGLPAAGPTTTQATAKPTGFGEKLTNLAQRYGPQIAGTLVAGPVGGLIGGLLGRSFDAARPGQLLGNPFQGLANTARAMGMFQSGTPYAGPISNYGTGLRAIGDVLGGAAPVGSRAYSRSTPGYHVTSLPGGMVQKTNQYGFTSFERPSMGPTGSSFPGGVFSGGGFFGGGGQQSGKTSGGRTSGSRTGSSRSGGRKSERSESAGY